MSDVTQVYRMRFGGPLALAIFPSQPPPPVVPPGPSSTSPLAVSTTPRRTCAAATSASARSLRSLLRPASPAFGGSYPVICASVVDHAPAPPYHEPHSTACWDIGAAAVRPYHSNRVRLSARRRHDSTVTRRADAAIRRASNPSRASTACPLPSAGPYSSRSRAMTSASDGGRLTRSVIADSTSSPP